VWRLELSNVLLQAERRGRIGVDDVARRLSLIAAPAIATDPKTSNGPAATPWSWRGRKT